MKLRILSDLHLEVKPWTFQPAGEDLVILAGDICDRSKVARHRRDVLFEQIRRANLRAIYLLGNHEGYQGFFTASSLAATVRSELPEHVTLLERNFIDLDGIRFLGCTLWTDFTRVDGLQWRGKPLTRERAKSIAENGVPDFLHLRSETLGEPPLMANDLIAWHERDRSWLDREITASPGPVVVATHFLPGPASVDSHRQGSALNPYYGSDCRDLMRRPVRLWIHGHTHASCDHLHGDVQVICNPRGDSTHPNYAFQSSLVMELRLS